MHSFRKEMDVSRRKPSASRHDTSLSVSYVLSLGQRPGLCSVCSLEVHYNAIDQ